MQQIMIRFLGSIFSIAVLFVHFTTLLIWKNPDPYLSVKQGRRAERLIPGAKLAVIKGYGHAPHQQKDNSRFCNLMLEFLDGSDGPDDPPR